jgi:hypothetical protein
VLRRLLQLSAVALVAGLAAAPASAQGVQGVYVCNDTSDHVAWKLHCTATSPTTNAERWMDDFLANARKVPVTSYIGQGRSGGLLPQPELGTFSPEEWNASLGR